MYKIEKIKNKIICGDALEELKRMPSDFVDCIITSPPYWSTRSYLPENHPDKLKEVGLEDHPQQYIDKIVEISLECVRVLKKTGVFFLNLGDVFYTRSQKNSWLEDKLNKGWKSSVKHRINARGKYKDTWLKRKGRLLLPMRIAIELQNKGIIIRDVIIWVKKLTKYPEKTSIGTTIPFPVKDRLLPAFEYIFQIVKSQKYYFNLELIKNELKMSSIQRLQYPTVETYPQDNPYKRSMAGIEKFRRELLMTKEVVNWDVKLKKELTKANPTNVVMFTQGNQFTVPQGHYAKFPESLVEFFILVGCPENGIVLDPFMGSGTVGVVAKRLGRNFIGIELNLEYIKIAEERIKNVPESLF
jgi:site-specific DNA-methyltransferase (adenine-specific)